MSEKNIASDFPVHVFFDIWHLISGIWKAQALPERACAFFITYSLFINGNDSSQGCRNDNNDDSNGDKDKGGNKGMHRNHHL